MFVDRVFPDPLTRLRGLAHGEPSLLECFQTVHAKMMTGQFDSDFVAALTVCSASSTRGLKRYDSDPPLCSLPVEDQEAIFRLCVQTLTMYMVGIPYDSNSEFSKDGLGSSIHALLILGWTTAKKRVNWAGLCDDLAEDCA